MKIKGASQRILNAAKTLWRKDGQSRRRVQTSEKPSPSLTEPVTAQDIVTMLATPRNSIASVGDDDLDSLVSEGRSLSDASTNTRSVASMASSSEAAPSEALEPVKSIEDGGSAVDDIEEWLVLTRFHDEAYRQTTLTRHRRLKAIEQEKRKLLREEQKLRQDPLVEVHPAPTASATLESTTGPAVAIKQENISSSPPLPSAFHSAAARRKQKRPHDEMTEAKIEPDENRAKFVRHGSLEHFPSESKHVTLRHPAPPSKGGFMHQDSTDISHRFTRSDQLKDYNSPQRAQQAPDTRYFHIRSWNYDNVVTAQNTNVWLTQKSNEALLVEAFTKSRRVILFFSVNHSRAFQGIAKMVSLPGQLGESHQPVLQILISFPGAAHLPTPSWQSALNFPTTEPFAIVWLLKADISHHIVRHLKNPFNRGLPAHVGTDGMEIESHVGEQMFNILHDFARENSNPM